MPHLTPHRRLRGLACVLALLALPVAGCGTSAEEPASTQAAQPAQQADAKAAEQVPEAVAADGKLTIASDATYSPNEFIAEDGKTLQGMDIDLGRAIAERLGLEVEFKNSGFDSIIPGLEAGKFELGMSSFTDTREREKTVDFVTYFSAGTSFYTKAQGGTEITDLASTCGKRIAVQKGSTQADDLNAQAPKCDGNPPKVALYPDQNAANLALSSGRADAAAADSPVAAYQVKQSGGQFELVGEQYGTAPYGIAMPKDGGLAEPVLAAVEGLIADGAYAEILKKWGVEGGAIDDPKINGAIS